MIHRNIKKPFTILNKLTYSNTWQTMLSVIFMVVISVSLTTWFFWRILYLPELKNHARYLATELTLLDDINQNGYGSHSERKHLRDKMHTVYVDDPDDFPLVEEKFVAEFFTKILQTEVESQLGRPVTVFFKFKPTSQLWIHDSKYTNFWIREPVIYYSQYNPTLLIGFTLGIPLLSLLTILLLVRQLNRPLKNLQSAATNYTKHGHATILTTDVGSTEIRQVNKAFNQLFITLTQAQKERNIMLAGISHDLRTPLTRMRLSAEMLPDEFLKEGLIYDVEDMDAILEQFISFMKDGSDEQPQLTDLNTIFHEVVVQFAPIEFLYSEIHLPPITLRSLSIKRMIVNLINNANRYGKPPIVINARIQKSNLKKVKPELATVTDLAILDKPAKDEESDFFALKTKQEELVITIYDHGDGVKEDSMVRIMQPFERGETARTIQGSGLGLSIVNRIARLHNGYVEIKNHNEGGLMIEIFIPILDETLN